MTVDQANQSLRNCPQPLVVIDSPTIFGEFLDVSPRTTHQDQQQPRSWGQWVRDVGKAFGRRVADALVRERTWEEEQAIREYNRRQKSMLEYKYAQAERWRQQEAQAEQYQQTSWQPTWTDSWVDDVLRPSHSGLSNQVFQPTEYGVYSSDYYTAPTNQPAFQNTYTVLEGQAAMHQQQQRLQELEQARLRLEQQAQQINVQTQTHVHTQQQQGW